VPQEIWEQHKALGQRLSEAAVPARK